MAAPNPVWLTSLFLYDSHCVPEATLIHAKDHPMLEPPKIIREETRLKWATKTAKRGPPTPSGPYKLEEKSRQELLRDAIFWKKYAKDLVNTNKQLNRENKQLRKCNESLKETLDKLQKKFEESQEVNRRLKAISIATNNKALELMDEIEENKKSHTKGMQFIKEITEKGKNIIKSIYDQNYNDDDDDDNKNVKQ